MRSPAAKSGKRVAFLFAHLHKGGMQKAVSNISCALPPEIEQHVVYFGTENPGFTYQAKMVDLAIPGAMQTGPVAKARNMLRRIKLLQDFIDENRIDTVVSFGEAASILNSLTKRKRTVLSVRVSVEEGLKDAGWVRPYYDRLVKIFYRHADLVVPVSKALAEQMTRLYHVPADKMRVIYNLYDLERIRALAKEPLPSEVVDIFAKPVLINVGSLIYQKGQEFLVRAFAIAKRSLPDLRLVIIGQGELKEKLEHLASELGVSDSVHLLGFDTNPYRYLARSRVFALTSRFEGFPNVLAEAMICGLPVIATDCKTGPSEILGDSEHGILLPDITAENASKVEEDLAASVLMLLKPECAERFGRQAATRAEDFSHESLVRQWVEAL